MMSPCSLLAEMIDEKWGRHKVRCLNTCDRGGSAQPGFDWIDPKISDLPDIWLLVQSGMVRLCTPEHVLYTPCTHL